MRLVRPALASLLWTSLAVSGAQASEARRFPDVPSGHWAETAADWLADRDLVFGWGGKLHGDRPLTRYELLAFFQRFMERYERERGHVEERFEDLEAEDARLNARLDELFETNQEGRLGTPSSLRSYLEEHRRARSRARSAADRSLTPPPDPKVPVQERLHELHARIAEHRRQGLRTPLLVVPPGGVAEVHGPRNSGGERALREGVYVLAWGEVIRVPKGSAASVVYPDRPGGFLMMEGSGAVIGRDGMLAREGRIQEVAEVGS